jgi:hypothetical protein
MAMHEIKLERQVGARDCPVLHDQNQLIDPPKWKADLNWIISRGVSTTIVESLD